MLSLLLSSEEKTGSRMGHKESGKQFKDNYDVMS